MITFIHTADIHLDSPLKRLETYEGAPVDEIRHATRRAFENLVDLAVAESVNFVLIAGDLFDGGWKDYNTGLYFIGQIHRLKKAGIRVFIVSGNHDAEGRMTRSLPYPDTVHLFSHRRPETVRMDALKVAVHGQSFATPAVMENIAAGYPKPVAGYFNIGLLHTSLNGREGHETYAPCALHDLQNKGYDYWALGHVHQFEIVCPEPAVVFPGCIQGRHAREIGAKGGVRVSAVSGAPPEIALHPVDVIRWAHAMVDVRACDTTRDCLAAFRRVLEKRIDENEPLPVIARVTFTGKTRAHGALSGDPDLFKETVRSTALAEFGERAWIEKVLVETRPVEKEAAGLADPGPLLELERLVAEIREDPESLVSLGRELSPIFRKLPAQYRSSEGGIDPEDPGVLGRIVEQAHALIARGLRKETPEP